MDLGLTDGTWLVTGGSSGLGLASAAAVGAEGGHVVITGRHSERGRQALSLLPSGSRFIQGDLADPQFPEQVLAAADGGRPVRGAVISVGGPPAGLPTSVTDDEWRSAFDTVFLGPVRLTRYLAESAPRLESVVWVLSSSARSPITGLAISNGLRPGLAMLVKDFADELGPRGIRVNGLLPGRFETPRVMELESAAPDPDQVRRHFTGQIPLRRYGDPAEFGGMAAILLSRRASYVTGSLVSVDGGSTRAP